MDQMLRDIAEGAYALIDGWDTMVVTGFFIVGMLGLFIAGSVAWWRARAFAFQHSVPAFLTTLGILGTFLGIAIGLLAFDVSDIEASIPGLLAGLKTAFVSSIVGMALSVAFKLITQIERTRDSGQQAEIGPEAIHAELREQNKSLAELRSAIAGEGESTIVTQLQKTRSTMQDEVGSLRTEMTREFRHFAEQISEMGSRQLIEALEKVIRDFNQNLTEQFGDNFKRLDESVKKLLDWQQEYKDQVEVITNYFRAVAQGIGESEAQIKRIAEHTGQIPEHIQRQQTILGALEEDATRLEALLKAYAEMRDRAAEAVPTIDAKLKDILDQMMQSVDKVNDHYDAMLAQSEKANSQLRSSAEKIQSGAQALEKDLATALANTEKALKSNTENAFNEQWQAMDRLFSGLRDNMNQSVQDQEKMLNDGMSQLDERLQEEMERAMQLMANQLGAITEKFVVDYSELTQNMKRVVDRNGEFLQ